MSTMKLKSALWEASRSETVVRITEVLGVSPISGWNIVSRGTGR
jgi:hypothetical protein